ncbi:MAG: ABC transporter ATP-binding protein [Clostridiales bacterium]|nr:ABC transporter ATP-binding protein [Clostridiales bacterium]
MVVEVKNLTKKYNEKSIALDNVSLDIKEGEILGILGPNGSGKTTLINSILGLIKYQKGDIKLFGKSLDNKTKSKIGIVPQELAFFDTLSTEENIDFFCSLYIKDNKLKKQYVKEAIDFVSLNGHEKKTAKSLSGGLQRRLNIACGIVHKPTLIFLDEPTVAIDPQSRNFILEGLKTLNKNGATIVYTTHYMEEAEILCDRIAIMDIAKFSMIGTKSEIMEKMNIKSIIHLSLENPDDSSKLPEKIRNIKENEYILPFDYSLDELLSYLKDNNIKYNMEQVLTPTLNDLFLILTGRKLRDE